jgi:hypothetical protein
VREALKPREACTGFGLEGNRENNRYAEGAGDYRFIFCTVSVKSLFVGAGIGNAGLMDTPGEMVVWRLSSKPQASRFADRATKNRSRPTAFVRFFRHILARRNAAHCFMGGPKCRKQPERYMTYALKFVKNHMIKNAIGLDLIKYTSIIKLTEDNNILDKKYFNDNVKKYDEIFFPIVIAWYIIFSIFSLTIDYLYCINFHDNDALLIAVPFFHIPFSWIFWALKGLFNIPHGDREYILNYYREIYGKIYMKKYSRKIMG